MRHVLVVSLFLLAAACGASSGPDLAAWSKASAEVRASVESYETLNASPSTQAQCAEHMQAYLAEVRPKLQWMRELGGAMDGCLHSLDNAEAADIESRCLQMEDELLRYAATACASEEPAVNQAAASAHCSRMLEQLTGTDARADTMRGMMGTRMMGSEMMSGGSCQP